MSKHARKLVTADGQVVSRAGKLRSITWATADTGSVIFHSGTSGGDPEIYRLVQGTGIHVDLDIGFIQLFADVTGTVSINVIYE